MATLELESAIIEKYGMLTIAGLDEAGRGALAGPVVAAAVILPLELPDCVTRFAEVNDSKQLTANMRARLYNLIKAQALTYGIGAASSHFVDHHGVIAATKLAMMEALAQLDPKAAFLLIDGRIRLSRSSLPQQSVIRGDSRSLSIAAASILAKVTRDQHMVDLDSRYPHYGFAHHKGYGTLRHRQALERYGPTPEHRFSFAPIRTILL